MSVKMKYRYIFIIVSALAIYYVAKNGVWIGRIVGEQQNNVESELTTNQAFSIDSLQKQSGDSVDGNNAKRHFPPVHPVTSVPYQMNLTNDNLLDDGVSISDNVDKLTIENEAVDTTGTMMESGVVSDEEKLTIEEQKEKEEVGSTSFKPVDLLNKETRNTEANDNDLLSDTANSANFLQMAEILNTQSNLTNQNSEIASKIQESHPLPKPIRIQKVEEKRQDFQDKRESNINQGAEVSGNIQQPMNEESANIDKSGDHKNETGIGNGDSSRMDVLVESSSMATDQGEKRINESSQTTANKLLVPTPTNGNINDDDTDDMFVVEDGNLTVDKDENVSASPGIQLSDEDAGESNAQETALADNGGETMQDQNKDSISTLNSENPSQDDSSLTSASKLEVRKGNQIDQNTIEIFNTSTNDSSSLPNPSTASLGKSELENGPEMNTFTNSLVLPTMQRKLKNNEVVKQSNIAAASPPNDQPTNLKSDRTIRKSIPQYAIYQTLAQVTTKDQGASVKDQLQFTDAKTPNLPTSPAPINTNDKHVQNRNTIVPEEKVDKKLSSPAVDNKVDDLEYDSSKELNPGNNCDDSIHPKPFSDETPHGHCLFYSEYFNTCQKGNQYYPKEDVEQGLKCKSKQFKRICRFKEDTGKLNCNVRGCTNGTMKIGVFNKKTGHFDYQKVDSARKLLLAIRKEMSKWNRLAPFIFLYCKARFPQTGCIRQILTFPEPKNRKKPSKKSDHQPNINVVVIDSLSRQHFYRMLPKTVKSLQKINKATRSPSSITEALDFKGMQSLAPFTYVNIHALMNGTIDRSNYKRSASNTRRDYPIQKLFTAFRMSGYRTLLQEDSCWHDKWGSLLTGNEKIQDSKSKKAHKELWLGIQDTINRWSIHDLGLTHMTCEALKKYDMTSLFDTHRMLCMNGRAISSYFIDYLIERAVDSPNTDPILSYTHINFGHEKSGKRIRALDDDISRLVRRLERKENTITFIISDHGGKQSKYSINTIPGRYEVYDSLMFMIVPKSLKHQIGEGTYKTLKANQNSLITVLDIRDTIIKVLNLGIIVPDSIHTKSLLSTSLAERRDCQEIGVRKYALCKCLSNINLLSPKESKYKDFLVWLGEYAVGQLNNKISEYLDKDVTHPSKCMRIQADELRLVIEEQNQDGVVYTFDVKTKKQGPDYDIFNFRIHYNSKRFSNTSLIDILTWTRISMYQKYQHCHDREVPLDVCICTDKSRFETSNHTKLTSYHQFGAASTVRIINDIHCLFLLRRDNNLNVVTFEILNLCKQKVRIVFDVKTCRTWQVSQSLPIELNIRSKHIKFAATFLKSMVTMDEIIQPVIHSIWG